jgi:cell division protein FtsW
MVYSSSYLLAVSKGLDNAYFLKQQLLSLLLGLGLFTIIQSIDYPKLKQMIPVAVFLNIFFLALVFLPTANISHNGVERWVRLGYLTFQPSEFARFVMLAYFAYYIDKKGIKVNGKYSYYAAPAIVWSVMMVLILIEPNYGMFVEMGIVFIALVFIAGTTVPSFLLFLGICITVSTIFLLTGHYRIMRILSFINPHNYYDTYGYQVIQSLISFVSGGMFGTGIGAGKQKLLYLPEMHNDFIFAVIGEETGFSGVLMVATSYLILFFLCIRISRRSSDIFGKYFSLAVGLSITLRAFINMSICLNLLPSKGMVLPFLSYGKSSMVANLIALGFVYKISNMESHPRA